MVNFLLWFHPSRIGQASTICFKSTATCNSNFPNEADLQESQEEMGTDIPFEPGNGCKTWSITSTTCASGRHRTRRPRSDFDGITNLPPAA